MHYRVEVYETQVVLCEYIIEADNADEARENAQEGIGIEDRIVLHERETEEPKRQVLSVEEHDL